MSVPSLASLRQRLQRLNIYLVGMMGCGKSTVGRALARELGYGFLDTDAVVEQWAGQSISEVFAHQGEAAFRNLETKVLASAAAHMGIVVATGGGMVLRPENWSYLHQGLVIWLDVSLPLLQRRLHTSQHRPLLVATDLPATLAALLEQRQPLYSQADLRIVCVRDEPPDRLALRVAAAIPGVLRDAPPPT